MPLTYAEYNAKRNNVRYWTEYGQTVAPTTKYLAAGMEAVANQLREQSPELSRQFQNMADAMFNATGETDYGAEARDIEAGLRQMDGLYAFLDQSTDGVTNRQRLEQALNNDASLKDRYLVTDESKNTTFQQQLDNVGDFFVISQRAIDEEIERDRRQRRIAGFEQLRLVHEQRLRAVDERNIPEAQKNAEKERIQQEYEEMVQRIEEGAAFATEQVALNERLENERRAAQEEQERLRREDEQRRADEQRRREEENRRREDELRQQAEQRRQREAVLRQRQINVRSQQGAFSMPRGYDYRDAAIHFTRSMQNGKPEDSPVFKLADNIHRKREAMEAEVNGIIADVDRSMRSEGYYGSIQKLPFVHDDLVSRYGNLGLKDKLEDQKDDPEREAKLFAEMKEEELVTDARRRDLLNRFPGKEQLNKQMAPHRIQARRNLLKDRLGNDLDLRMRQKENELTASALEEKFFLNNEYKENLQTVLENKFGQDLQAKLAQYAGEPNPAHMLFHNEVYLPALRNRDQWQKLGTAMGLPKEFTIGGTTEYIPNMDIMAQIARGIVKPEAVERALFEDLNAMHPEEALYDKVELEAEKALYASLHPEEPKPNGSQLFDTWLREERIRLALGDKQDKLDEIRKLDEAAEGLKKNCLDASKENLGEKSPACQDKLSKASRFMKDTACRLASLEKSDPQQFKELADDMDKEWVKMDLMGSKEIRDAQDIPEQFLYYPQPIPYSPWPFDKKGAGQKPEKRQFREYEYHAFDMDTNREVWTDETISDDENFLDQELEDAQNYSFVDMDFEQDVRSDTEKFIDGEWDKLAQDRPMSSEFKQKTLARIVAAYRLWQPGSDKQPTEEEIDAMADQLRKQANFKQIVEYVDTKIFARTRRVDLIEKCMEKTVPPQDKQDAQRAKLQQTATTAAENMLATKKGTSYFFGVSRFLTGNSTRYENALGAIQEVQHNPNADRGAAIETVKTYLQDKMKKRDREFGRVRWKQCMDFLKVAMPRKEFEDYCRDVNRARRVNSIADEDFVAPEMFGPPQTAKEMQDEIVERFRSGEGTRHDLTVLAALKDMNLRPNEVPDIRKLLTEAEKIDNTDLNYIMQFGTAGQQVRLAEKLAAAGKEDAVNSKSIIQRVGEQLQKNKGPKAVIEGLEDPVGLEEELMEIATEGRSVKKHLKNSDPKKTAGMKPSDRKDRESEPYIEEGSQNEIILTN